MVAKEDLLVTLCQEHMEAKNFLPRLDRLGKGVDYIQEEMKNGALCHFFELDGEKVGVALSYEYDAETLEFYHFVQLTEKDFSLTDVALRDAPKIADMLGYKCARLTTSRPALAMKTINAGWSMDHCTLSISI